MKRVALLLIALVPPFACVAFVEAPLEALLPCVDDACEQEGYVCGYVSAPIVVDDVEVPPCVPARCLVGYICDPGCNCACEGCAEGDLCDNQNTTEEMRASGEACVPRSCYNDDEDDFECGTPGCLDCVD